MNKVFRGNRRFDRVLSFRGIRERKIDSASRSEYLERRKAVRNISENIFKFEAFLGLAMYLYRARVLLSARLVCHIDLIAKETS